MDERLFRLGGRAGLVVGAGSGIGRAIALAFGSVGATLLPRWDVSARRDGRPTAPPRAN